MSSEDRPRRPWRQQKRGRRALGLAAALTAWMAVHYTIVGLHLLPRNAITILHPEPIDRYVQPFFAQDWHLFAPKPPIANERVEVQLRLEPVGGGAAPGVSRWFDVTSPLQRRIFRNPLAPEVTRLRTIDGVNGQYRNYLARRAAVPGYAAIPEAALDADAYERMLFALAAEVYDPARFRLVAVRGRTLINEVPPFSEANNPDFRPAKAKAITTDWFFPRGGAGGQGGTAP